MATLVKSDVGVLITGHPLLADLIELGSGDVVYQLKTAASGGGGGGQITGPLVDDSGTIASANVAQSVMGANATRKYFFFQNVSDTTMWINFGVAANEDQPSIELLPAAAFVADGFYIPSSTVSVICSASGKSYTAKQGG